jgi:glucokinase
MTTDISGRLILAGDIGGTNTNLALVSHEDGSFRIVFSRRYSTQAEISLVAPMERFLREASTEGYGSKIGSCCVSAAGPVIDGSVRLTNAPWSIHASELSERFGLPVHLINDFAAVSYAVALLDPRDREQIGHIPHCDGSEPVPGGGMALVVGAGTGLGVGFMEKGEGGECRVYPSEGGHAAMPCWDERSFAFYRWMKDRLGFDPSIERAVSGQGIDNIFSFLCSDGFPGQLAASILEKSESERPALIAANRLNDPRCSQAMELFAEFYAREVSSLATAFLPDGGIWLAGGISSKNEAFLIENRGFMKPFEINSEPHIRKFLAGVPVMIVRNYSISLIGAANAACQLERSRR